MPTREQQREQTRHELLAAAATVFADRGFHAASVDDVAAAAGYTKGAIYSNFSSKEELFLALFDEQVEEAVERIEELFEATAPERRPAALGREHRELRIFDRSWFLLEMEFLLYAARTGTMREQLAERQRAARERITALVARHMEELGLDADQAAPADVARLLVAASDGLMIMHLADPDAVDPAGDMTTLVELLTRAANAPG